MNPGSSLLRSNIHLPLIVQVPKLRSQPAASRVSIAAFALSVIMRLGTVAPFFFLSIPSSNIPCSNGCVKPDINHVASDVILMVNHVPAFLVINNRHKDACLQQLAVHCFFHLSISFLVKSGFIFASINAGALPPSSVKQKLG